MSDDRVNMAKKLQEGFDKYKPAVDASVDALDDTLSLLKALQSGDREAVESRLTKWQDVNETLAAIGNINQAIDDKGIDWKEGLELTLGIIGNMIKVAAVLA